MSYFMTEAHKDIFSLNSVQNNFCAFCAYVFIFLTEAHKNIFLDLSKTFVLFGAYVFKPYRNMYLAVRDRRFRYNT